jgi:hypothetical protein
MVFNGFFAQKCEKLAALTQIPAMDAEKNNSIGFQEKSLFL